MGILLRRQTSILLCPAIETSVRTIVRKLCGSSDIFDHLALLTLNEDLRQYASQEGAKRVLFARHLRAELTDSTTVFADNLILHFLRRTGWRLRVLLPHARSSMLAAVETAETSLRAAYLQTLEQNFQTPALRDVLHQQQAHVSRAQAELRSLLHRSRLA